MEATEGPKKYKLETLLAEGMQVWPDISAEELESLKLIVKTGNYLPILISGDRHRMYDGHQRCLALLELGRKTIPADKVMIMDHVTEANIWGEAIAMQSVGRQVTAYDKAQAMHRAVARGKSQRQIAKAFRVSQSAVSQLMSAYPADSDSPAPSDYINAADGKRYKRPKRKEPAPDDVVWTEPKGQREPVHPWASGGDVGRALRKMRSAMAGWSPDTVHKELTAREWSETITLINETIDAATRWVQQPTPLEDDSAPVLP